MPETETPGVVAVAGILAAVGGVATMGFVTPTSVSVVVIGGVLLVATGIGLSVQFA